MSEKNPDNIAIANQSIPITRITGDPLLEKAKAKAPVGTTRRSFHSGKNMRIISGKAGGIALSVPKGSAAHDRPGQGGPFPS